MDHSKNNLFQPIIDQFHRDSFDETAYTDIMHRLEHHGVEDFIDFLGQTLCIYPAINDFLIKCLSYANEHRDGFDT